MPTTTTPPNRVADVLRLLADCRSTGAVEVLSADPGTFFLEDGRVVSVQTGAVPADPSSGALAVVDAALALLDAPSPLPPRFVQGVRDEGQPTAPPTPPWPVDDLLREVDRWRGRLAHVGVGPDDLVSLRPLRGRGVLIEAEAWRLVMHLTRPRTPRELARLSGHPLAVTLIGVDSLLGQGACGVVRATDAQPADRPRGRSRRAADAAPTDVAVTTVADDAPTLPIPCRPTRARDVVGGAAPEPAEPAEPAERVRAGQDARAVVRDRQATWPAGAPLPPVPPAATAAQVLAAMARAPREGADISGAPLASVTRLPRRSPGEGLAAVRAEAGAVAVGVGLDLGPPDVSLVTRLLAGLRRL